MKELFTNIISIQPGVIMAILLLIASRSVIKRRYVAKLRYWLWLVVALRLALPLDINVRLDRQAPVNIPVQEYYVAAQHSGQAERLTDYEIITADQLAAVYSQPSENETPTENVIVRTIPIADILCQVWIAMAMGLLWASFLSYWLAKRDVMQTAVFDKDLNRYMNNLMQEMGIDRPVRLAVCDYTGSPMLMGIFDPVIVLPRADYTQMQLSMILRHELTHYRRHDVAYKFLMHILACVYWFNPLVYLMGRYTGMDIEFSCDEDTVKHTDKQFKAEYARTIVKVITMQNNRFMLATTFSQNAQTVKERFTNIFLNRRLKRGRNILAGFMAVVLFATTMVGCTTASSTGNTNITVPVTGGNGVSLGYLSDVTFENSRVVYNRYNTVSQGLQYNQDSFGEYTHRCFNYIVDDGSKYGTYYTAMMDGAGNITMLCSKENCSHNSKDCYAYDENALLYFFINNKIYGFSSYKSSENTAVVIYNVSDTGKTLFCNIDGYLPEMSNIVTDGNYLYLTAYEMKDGLRTGDVILKISLADASYTTYKAPEGYIWLTVEAVSDDGNYIILSGSGKDTGRFTLAYSVREDKTVNIFDFTDEILEHPSGGFGGYYYSDNGVYLLDMAMDVLRFHGYGASEDTILIENLSRTFDGTTRMAFDGLHDNKLIVYSYSQNNGMRYYTVDLATFEIKELTMKGKDDGGFTRLVKIHADLGDNLLIATNYTSALRADMALISKEDFYNDNPRIVPLGNYRIG